MKNDKSTKKKTIKKLRQTKWQKIKEYEPTARHSALKSQLLSMISQSINVRKVFHIGLNSVMKSIERKQCSIVCLCRDVPKNLLDSLVDACLFHKISIACLPELSTKEVASSFALSRVSCFSLPTLQLVNSGNLNELEKGLIDGIREILEELSLSSKNMSQ